MGKLFGTDGIRGIANEELTPWLCYQLGRAGAYVLTKESKSTPTIVVGKDTRLSGDLLELALTAGMCSVGAKVFLAGVIPTPGIAYLVRKNQYDAGVVISASHNPYGDNGIKFFSNEGYKLRDDLEEEIEDLILNNFDSIKNPTPDMIGTKVYKYDLLYDYVDYLKTTVDGLDLSDLDIILDCANGATYKAAPEIFHRLNSDPYVLFNSPSGKNINENCGSTHMETLISTVKEKGADIGIAYDGDGDRCLFVDEKGNLVDGDQVLSIIGNYLKEENRLNNNGFVATVMSNLGLFIMGEEEKIKIEKTKVGDRYVLEEMLNKNYNLGGEQSGHVIFLDYNTTGDGILTSLQLLKIMKEKNISLSELNTKMKVMPQVLVNAIVSNEKKDEYLENQKIKEETEKLTALFEGKGRVLVRPSGTEPLIRVMIEGNDLELLEKEANRLKDLIEAELN